MQIEVGDLGANDVAALLRLHVARAAAQFPTESVHALDSKALAAPNISFWTARRNGTLLGFAALKTLSDTLGEVKSMRTADAYLGQGVGYMLLHHTINVARQRGMQRLSLETGTTPSYWPAHRLYQKFGFRACGPFASYTHDPNSQYMTLDLSSVLQF